MALRIRTFVSRSLGLKKVEITVESPAKIKVCNLLVTSLGNNLRVVHECPKDNTNDSNSLVTVVLLDTLHLAVRMSDLISFP